MNTPAMTIRETLRMGERELVRGGVPNPRRNAEWMLCHALSCTPLYIHVNAHEVVGEEAARKFVDFIDRRATREPLQHVLEATEFMSLPFAMQKGVFIPRPETETLAETALEFLRSLPLSHPLSVLELCCGSGAVGIALARSIPNLQVYAVDLNPQAVQLTRRNAVLNGVEDRVQALCSDAGLLLEHGGSGDWPPRFAAIVCNPPYIASREVPELAPEVSDWDPIEALDGGADGLDFYRAVAPRLRQRLDVGAAVMFEIGSTQGAAVEQILRSVGLVQGRVLPDMAGRDRVVTAASSGESEQ